ncbi:GIY-YIG nuclease family protein [Porticoccaceae bacterium]|nr:GIY-YIG nuclease family protein [Porticoccaceae bacterium]MDB2343551.1 GIY-YIG nuclease family protein [Porticoccaceae bacterium]MDB2664993.1 GIY-YIG nuclease family protein [Porticoccaceae bacterium]
MAKFTEEDDNLLAELGIEVEAKKKPTLSARDERIIAGFEEIQKFVEENGREPAFTYDGDIFERLYATRLEQIRRQPECVELLQDSDHQDLLNENLISNITVEEDLDDDALLEELGLNTNSDNDLTALKHVKPRAEIQPAKEVGQRIRCQDFETFKPLFDQVQADIKSGVRKIVPFRKDGSVEKGNLFILSGQKAYVAEVGDPFTGVDGRNEHRLRLIFDNGVESNQLMHSLQKRLWDDETGRRITDSSMGPLFDDVLGEGDTESGTIYVLRSLSDHPVISESQDIVHKIGVTGGEVKKRIANAQIDPTFLMANVEVVATFELYNINPTKLENLLHKFFSAARLEIMIADRFGNLVAPREWFLVPFFVISEVVEKIVDGTIGDYQYDVESATLIQASD